MSGGKLREYVFTIDGFCVRIVCPSKQQGCSNNQFTRLLPNHCTGKGFWVLHVCGLGISRHECQRQVSGRVNTDD